MLEWCLKSHCILEIYSLQKAINIPEEFLVLNEELGFKLKFGSLEPTFFPTYNTI